MRAVPLMPVTATEVTATSLALTDNPVWVLGTYAAGAVVTHNSKNWEAKISTTVEPSETATADWYDLGAVNYLQMFDGKKATATVGANDQVITYSLFFNTWLNTLKMTDIADCESVRIQLNDPTEGIVYDQTFELVDYSAPDAYEYFFSEITYLDQITILDLPPYSDATINATITPLPSKKASIGTTAIGNQTLLGDLQFGYSVGIADYGEYKFDQYGGLESRVQRGFADTGSFPVSVDTNNVYTVKKYLASLRGTTVLWIGAIDRPETHIIGIYQEFGCVVPTPTKSDYNISLIGVI